MKLRPETIKVLKCLADNYDTYEGFHYHTFNGICSETSLNRPTVRRACRLLTRKGLAQFGRGLWTEDGTPAGSGYAATSAGKEFVVSGGERTDG
jgi:1,4-dihydroxy-2-naphthoyl-CoA synthase